MNFFLPSRQRGLWQEDSVGLKYHVKQHYYLKQRKEKQVNYYWWNKMLFTELKLLCYNDRHVDVYFSNLWQRVDKQSYSSTLLYLDIMTSTKDDMLY